MKKITSMGLTLFLLLLMVSCGSSPEEQIREIISNGYEVTNGSFDNSKEEDKLTELIDKLKKNGEKINRKDIQKIWDEVRIDYWTAQMTACYVDELKDANVEDFINNGGCSSVTKRIYNDYGKRHIDDATKAIIKINEDAYKNWKENQ